MSKHVVSIKKVLLLLGEYETDEEWIAAGYRAELRPATRWTCPTHERPAYRSCRCEDCTGHHLRACCKRAEWKAILAEDGTPELVKCWRSAFERAMRKWYSPGTPVRWADEEPGT